MDLPINAALPALAQALTHRHAVLLEAPPGAGKSTLVPLFLLDSAWLSGQKILMLEPRRIAARAVANRMAALVGEPVGAGVGPAVFSRAGVASSLRGTRRCDAAPGVAAVGFFA